MKKILTIMLVGFMILCGCTPNQTPDNPQPTENVVDAKWLISTLNYDKGCFVTADQKTRVYFRDRNGDILIRQYNEEDEIEYLINKVVLQDNIYVISVTGSVSESSKYYVKEFHLDTSRLLDGKIELENLFKDGDKKDEFTFFSYPKPETDMTVIANILMENSGKWACAGQYETQYIYMENGIIYMENTESGSKKYAYKPVDYTVEGTVYTINLESDEGNFVLHVDIANIGETRIMAENRYQNDALSEYALLQEIDDEMKPKVYVMVDENLNEKFLPTLTLYADSSFGFVENVYEGMAKISGHWLEKDGYIVLYITEKSQLDGYAGSKQQELGFKIVDGGLVLENDLCYSQYGAFFKKQ